MERKLQIANRIKQSRLDLGLSQKQLGRLFGTSDVTIGEIERGISNITIPDLERLAKIFGRPLDWFLSDEIKLPSRPPEAALSELQTTIRAFIPVVDEISAGGGIVPLDYIALTRFRAAPEDVVALRIKGLCLDPEVRDGDTVIVDKTRTPQNGNLVVVIIDGEASLKRFKEDSRGGKWLENKYGHYQPEDVYIYGVVVNLDRPMV
jgi:SOS-response transcriptional repressor LexA